MKKFSLGCALILIFSACDQQNIVFMDNGKVINEYQGKKNIEEKYKKIDEAFKKRTDSIGQAFQLEAQAFQLEAKNLSERKAQEKYEELSQKQQFLQQQVQFEQQQMTQAFQSEIDSAIIEVKDFVKEYGKAKGYTYILGTSDAAASVLYGADGKDISTEIIQALNQDYEK